ncbi:MAG: response regulator transcription factor [Gammaproteobacteria bacterium]|nr:response regulator transcription factor [Gammaproteobacteria bacterium]
MNTSVEKLEQPKLLLVDDDEVFCQVLSRALIKREFQVEVAHSQGQAVRIASTFHPGLAIVDLRIGIESGLNMVRTLVDMQPDIRIVVLTGYASISTAVESIKLGAIHYLTKPTEVDEIIQALYRDKGNSNLPLVDRPMSPKRIEWEHLQKVLSDHDGNISAAARAMGMHRRSLQRKLNKKPTRHVASCSRNRTE